MTKTVNIVLVDDHALLRNGLSALVSDLGYNVRYECNNGKQLSERISMDDEPDIVLMDIHMPEMDGFETTEWLRNNYPLVNVIALSMFDDETSIIRMLKSGARGYILKDSNPSELKMAIDSVLSKGFYCSDLVSGSMLHSIDDQSANTDLKQALSLKSREVDFLKLVCTELTYKEISDKMHLSPRTVDGYRDELFQKLGVKSRIGLVLFAIKSRIVNLG